MRIGVALISRLDVRKIYIYVNIYIYIYIRVCQSRMHCNTRQYTATRCNTLHHAATHRKRPVEDSVMLVSTKRCCAIHCNTLQHTATHLFCPSELSGGCQGGMGARRWRGVSPWRGFSPEAIARHRNQTAILRTHTSGSTINFFLHFFPSSNV